MNRLRMHPLAAAALAVSCVAVPPPATDLPDSPASASAEEAPWDSQFRYLETEVEIEANDPVDGGMDHGDHGMQQAPAETSSDHGPPLVPSGSQPGARPLDQGAAHEGHAADQDHTSAPAEDAIELSYVCPMHPEVVREGPGTCPICGMAFEPQPCPASEADGR